MPKKETEKEKPVIKTEPTISIPFSIKNMKIVTDKTDTVNKIIIDAVDEDGKPFSFELEKDDVFRGDKTINEIFETEERRGEEAKKTTAYRVSKIYEKEGLDLSEIIKIRKKLQFDEKLNPDEADKLRKADEIAEKVVEKLEEADKKDYTEIEEFYFKRFNDVRETLKEYFMYDNEDQEKLLSSMWLNGNTTNLLLGIPGSGKSFYIDLSSLLFCNGLTEDELKQARDRWKKINEEYERAKEIEKDDPEYSDIVKNKESIRSELFSEIKRKMFRNVGILKCDDTKDPGETFYEMGIEMDSEPKIIARTVPDAYPDKIKYNFTPFPRDIVRRPIKFFNEINRANPATKNALLGMLAEKEIEYLGKLFSSPNNEERYIDKVESPSFLWAEIDADGNWMKKNLPDDADMDYTSKEQKKTDAGNPKWIGTDYTQNVITWMDSNPHVAQTMDRALLDRIDCCLYFPTTEMISKEKLITGKFEKKGADKPINVVIKRILSSDPIERIIPLNYKHISALWNENRTVSIEKMVRIISLSTEVFGVAGYFFSPPDSSQLAGKGIEASETIIHTPPNRLVNYSLKDLNMKQTERDERADAALPGGMYAAEDYPLNQLNWVLGVRCSESLSNLSRSVALIEKRKDVSENDIKLLLPYVTAHRYGFGEKIAFKTRNSVEDFYPNLQFWIKNRIVENYLWNPLGEKNKLSEWMETDDVLSSAIGYKEDERWVVPPNYEVLTTFIGDEPYKKDPIKQRIYYNTIKKLEELTKKDYMDILKEIMQKKNSNYSASSLPQLKKKIKNAIIIKSAVVPIKESQEEKLIDLLASMENYLKSVNQVSDPMGMKFLLDYLEKIIISPAFKKPTKAHKGVDTYKVKNGTIGVGFDYDKEGITYIIKTILDMDNKEDADKIIDFIDLCKDVSKKPENISKTKAIIAITHP